MPGFLCLPTAPVEALEYVGGSPKEPLETSWVLSWNAASNNAGKGDKRKGFKLCETRGRAPAADGARVATSKGCMQRAQASFHLSQCEQSAA